MPSIEPMKGYFIAEADWARMPEELRETLGPYVFGLANGATQALEVAGGKRVAKKRLSKQEQPSPSQGMGKEEAQRRFDLLSEDRKEFVRGLQELFAFERGEIELQDAREMLKELSEELATENDNG
jgi:hypothetical protein